MSFYSDKNVGIENMPCPVKDGNIGRIAEKVCVEVKKVYDAGLQQEQLDNVVITLTKVKPAVTFTPPLTFVSCRTTSVEGTIRNLTITPIENRPNFARVRTDVDILIEVIFTDADGTQGSGLATITVHKDIILFMPPASVIPPQVESIVNAVCVSGCYMGDFRFSISVCITVILKVVAEVELLIPAFGFCKIPPAEEYAENICEEIFKLPLYPPQLLDLED